MSLTTVFVQIVQDFHLETLQFFSQHEAPMKKQLNFSHFTTPPSPPGFSPPLIHKRVTGRPIVKNASGLPLLQFSWSEVF
jgi:hypothetical protein